MVDFESLLSELPKYQRRKPPEVDVDFLRRKAAAMARRGYRHTPTSLQALAAYLQGYGILLSGGLGVGKSFFFETLNPEPLEVLPFNRCYLWNAEKLEEWLDARCASEIVVDDLGWESGKSKNYGTTFDALQVVLDHRLTDSRARTHITTNCSNDELIEKYDAHLVDRVYQCCKCFVFPPAESQREADINSTYLRNLKYAHDMGNVEDYL